MSDLLPAPSAPRFDARPPTHARSRTAGGARILSFRGDLDFYGAPELAPLISEAARRGHHRVVIDLTDVGYVDSTGLAVLLNAKRRLTRLRGRMVIASDQESLLRLIHITRLGEDLDVRPSVEEALRAVSAP